MMDSTITTNELDAPATLRPISDDEWKRVLKDRERQAEERRRAAMWAPPLAELKEAIGRDEAAQLFIRRARDFGWAEDVIGDFVDALMKARGFSQEIIRNHGWVWKEVAR
jgi:hypothetical protein